MSFGTYAVTARIGADVDPLRAGFSKAQQMAKEFSGRMDGLVSQIRPPSFSFKGLKESVGEGSTFKNLSDLMAGAGIVAGVTVAARAMENLTAKAAELTRQFREGTTSAGQMADSMARSVPILGNLYAAGRNVREMLTGEDMDAARLLSTAQRLGEAWDAARANVAAMGAALDKVRDIQASVLQRTALVGLEGAARQVKQFEQAFDATVASIRAASASGLGEANAGLQAQITATMAMINKLQAQLPAEATKESSSAAGFATDGGAAVAAAIAANGQQERRRSILSDIASLERTIASLKAQQQANADRIGAAERDALASARGELGANLRDTFMTGAKDFWQRFKDGAKRAADAWRSNQDQISAVRDEIAATNMTGPERLAAAFAKNVGVTAQQVREFKSLAEQLDIAGKAHDLADQGKRYVESMQTAADRAKETARSLGAAYAAHRISKAQLDAGLGRAADEAGVGVDQLRPSTGLPELINNNSAAAIRAMFQAQQSVKDNAEAGKRHDALMQVLERIAKAAEDSKIEVGVAGDE